MNRAGRDTPQVVLSEVRKTLDQRSSAEETIRMIRRLLEPPTRHRPVELTDRGWPVLRKTGADEPPAAR